MQREGTEGGAVEVQAHCCIPSNYVRNEVLLFICFNSIQMCEPERETLASRGATHSY